MTKIDFLRKKKSVAMISSIVFVALIFPTIQPAFSGFVNQFDLQVTPDRQRTLVGETQTYSTGFRLGGDYPNGPPSLSVTCDSNKNMEIIPE